LIALCFGIVAAAAEAKTPITELTPDAVADVLAHLTILYPRDGAVFPADIAAPTFKWKDVQGASAWRITIQVNDRIVADADTTTSRWRPAKEQWEQIKKLSQKNNATVTITRTNSLENDVSQTSITIRTSADPVSSPIFYREVPLPVTAALSNMRATRWRLGYVNSYEQPNIVLQGLNVCANCHYATPDGKTLGIDVQVGGDKGAHIIAEIEKEVVFSKDRVMTWNTFMRDGQRQNFGLLSQFSPDGRYVISTVREWPVYHLFQDPGNPQLFFPVRGILALYDRKTKTFSALPGADDPAYVQTNAVWSPDGKWIVFARAKAVDGAPNERSFVERTAKFRYDLYRIPFNEGKGGRADPVSGAAGNDRSNYFPKFTPDGKWLIYTQSDSFMLNQPDAELHIIPMEGGKDRKMTCNAAGKMSSWHSISPNGNWIVFSSKANGPYTELWLTHLDKEGKDTPPVLLEDYTSPVTAANLPEFINIEPGMLMRIDNRLE